MISTVTVHRAPGHRQRGLLVGGPRVLPCALGRGGPGVLKREGDGVTPAGGPLRPLWGYWRADRGPRPTTALRMIPTRAGDGWCDAPTHPAYNRPVRLPFAASHETMWRTDALYDICIVLDWNMEPGRARDRGSAIFAHLAKDGYPPTEGCIALARRDMVWLLARIDRRTQMSVSA